MRGQVGRHWTCQVRCQSKPENVYEWVGSFNSTPIARGAGLGSSQDMGKISKHRSNFGTESTTKKFRFGADSRWAYFVDGHSVAVTWYGMLDGSPMLERGDGYMAIL